jgi:subtilisin-like proprotein convertase family protein
MVSGVVALMLQANPGLGYRDVQEILAYSAVKTGPSDVVWTVNGAGNLNNGGLHFNDAYGFGLVDAHAAVRLAETWNLQQTAENEFCTSLVNNNSVVIATGVNRSSSTIHVSSDMIVEHALVSINATYGGNLSNLEIVLTSPDGTSSILLNRPSASSSAALAGFTYDTVVNWGEHGAGDWRLDILNYDSMHNGTLSSWTLTLLGNAAGTDSLYVFTDENHSLLTVNDTDGGTDTINAAAMTRALSISLASSAGIENLYTGDGNDDVNGNARDNVINTGRGNDTIGHSGGADTIDGGAGTDTYTSDEIFNHAVTVNGTGDITLTSLADGTSTHLLNIEKFIFAGVAYDMPGLLAAARSGTLTDVIYFVHGTAGIAQGHSDENGTFAYTASDLNIGGQGVVLLAERDFDHLTLTNDAGPNLKGISMRMDDGLNLTVRGFTEVSLVADGNHATSIDIGGGQRGLIQTGGGDDTVNFTAYLIDRNAPAQERLLTASTGDGADTLTLDDRSSYLVYDINLGAGNDAVFAKGTQGGHIIGGAGADTFGFGLNNGAATGIYDFSDAEGDRLDLSQLLEAHNAHQDAIADFIQLSTQGGNTHVKVDNADVVTLYGTTLSDSVQHYIDTGLIVTQHA